MRAGQILCACPAALERASLPSQRATLALGFGLAVLAQALALTVLPEQGRLIAPTAARVGWPFALLMIGAALASFPASLLVDFSDAAPLSESARASALRAAPCAPSRSPTQISSACVLAPFGSALRKDLRSSIAMSRRRARPAPDYGFLRGARARHFSRRVSSGLPRRRAQRFLSPAPFTSRRLASPCACPMRAPARRYALRME